ncbi:MAG: hypothetical protein ACRC9L_07635 [Brevinema sp.]
MNKHFIITIFLIILAPIAVKAQETPKSPREVVVFALTSLTNGNIKALLDVTDGSEKKKTEEIIKQMDQNQKYKKNLDAEYKLLQSYSIEDVNYTTNNGRELAVVATRWVIKVPVERAPRNLVAGDKNARTANTVFMDYMLEKKNNSWKIISRRSL